MCFVVIVTKLRTDGGGRQRESSQVPRKVLQASNQVDAPHRGSIAEATALGHIAFDIALDTY